MRISGDAAISRRTAVCRNARLRARSAQSARSAGFTLIEIMLVLAILVVVASLALPNVLRTLETQKLKRAADGLRTTWMQCHVRAMKTGRIQVFRYELGTGNFETKPWEADDSQIETSAKVNPNLTAVPIDSSLEPRAEKLPDTIIFQAGDARFESRSATLENQLSQFDSGGAGWSRPLLFYPDGSTSSAHVVVAVEGKEDLDKDVGVRVKLRGLTGSVEVSDLLLLSEVTQ
jgi:prepilin-type N-terminal cleavage/methylation domain-containing protein